MRTEAIIIREVPGLKPENHSTRHRHLRTSPTSGNRTCLTADAEKLTDAGDGITRCWLIIDSKTGESARASDRRAPLFSNERLVRAPRIDPRTPRQLRPARFRYMDMGGDSRHRPRRPVPRSSLRRRPGGASGSPGPGPAAVGFARVFSTERRRADIKGGHFIARSTR